MAGGGRRAVKLWNAPGAGAVSDRHAAARVHKAGGLAKQCGLASKPMTLPATPDSARPHALLPVRLPPTRLPQSAKAFAAKVNAAGGKAEVFVYPGVGHGFLNKGGKVRACSRRLGTRSGGRQRPDRRGLALCWISALAGCRVLITLNPTISPFPACGSVHRAACPHELPRATYRC